MGEGTGKIKNFRDLDVWRLGMEIVVDVYKCTKGFPKEEMYGLISQMRRAALSIPSNVAEGFNRYHNKEYRQFLYIALGSCAELETQIEVSLFLTYITESIRDRMIEKLDHESRMLRNLIKCL
jgi:four helix bundle protein